MENEHLYMTVATECVIGRNKLQAAITGDSGISPSFELDSLSELIRRTNIPRYNAVGCKG